MLHIPKHIAIIMDGNGRWAAKRGLKRSQGHVAGAKAIKPVVLHCNSIGVKVLTMFAFSTENWNRPKVEVISLIKLINKYLDDMDNYLKYNVRMKFFGDLSVFSSIMRKKIKTVEEKFSKNTGMVFAIALNYGGKDEIKNAVKAISEMVAERKIKREEISEELINEHLYTRGFPMVDLLIRPGGECRISNFLLWQVAYAEFVFMRDVLWPDFQPEHIDLAIKEYGNRTRRYGKIV